MAMVRRFTDAQAFARVATPFLAQHEVLNNLGLRIAGNLARKPDALGPDVYLAVCSATGDPSAPVLGVAVRTPPFNLVVSCPCGEEALAAFSGDVPAAGLPGVIGRNLEAGAFAAIWQRKNGCALETAMNLRAHELGKVRATRRSDGELRRATEDDLGYLTEWERAFVAEALPHGPAPSGPTDLDGMFVWEIAHRPVSMVRARAGSPNGAVINSVYTPPALRRHGYATAAVAAASAWMLGCGFRFCMLFTDLANPTSNSIYQRIGYEPVGDFQQIQFIHAA